MIQLDLLNQTLHNLRGEFHIHDPIRQGTNNKAFNTLIKLMSYTCLAVWVAVLLLVPFIIFARFCESEKETVYRLRKDGRSYRWIAERLGLSVYRVKKNLTLTPQIS